MTCSPAQLASNRANAARSTGPRTPEGKERSRRNGLKHGLTGEGIALPDEDAAEVERRFAAFEAELAPRTELGRTLALRVATLSVRLERCYRNEAARLGLAVDSAVRAYDDGRRAAVEALMEGLDAHPETNARRLQMTPEGVQMTIDAWRDLGEDLAERGAWGVAHRERADNLMGRRPLDLPRSRAYVLSQGLWHDFSQWDPGELAGLDDRGKYEHAKREMLELIERRVVDLTAYRQTLDLEAAERARLGAPDRALFDESPGATLARKYEAATERSLYRTLREFREVEPATPAVEAIPEPAEVCDPLGSSLPGPSPEEEPAQGPGPAVAPPAPGAPAGPPRTSPTPPGSNRKGRKRALALDRRGS